ncbi:MAG: restriction endonuclease [Hyphomicrobiales bacterium]|nr:Eco29kI family restriction endonuclease [Hyphomicrobiales bacterium]PCJ86752.1 MAG: restriction endonuclease [Hyphomicrobiales bacterium]
MAKKPEILKADETQLQIDELTKFATSVELTAPSRRMLLQSIAAMQETLNKLTRELDLIRLPVSFFDPTEPRLIGHFVALALIAQDRRPLQDIGKAYGSGVYAIYYTGQDEPYAPISGTETPVYVGKADPPANAKSLRDQGTKLTDRLNEHRKNIEKVSGIDAADFECRTLAVQSGYQSSAEIHLIRLFKPIWNNETKILFGLGKHGDAATTRANNKSPWDTLHPGRAWAAANPVAKSAEVILREVSDHFLRSQIFDSTEDVFQAFSEGIKQKDLMNPEPNSKG